MSETPDPIEHDPQRAIELLRAVLEIFQKAGQGPYVKSVFKLTAFYDDAECDWLCLMGDIESYLDHGA